MLKIFDENSNRLVQKASLLKLSAKTLADNLRLGGFKSLYRGQGIDFYDIKNNITLDFWHIGPFTITEGKPSIIESINDNIVTVYGNGSLHIRSVWFYK